jgi:hypothetical protein
MKYFYLLLLLLSGCAGAQTALDNARTQVQRSGEELLRLYQVIQAGCSVEPVPSFCPELKQRFNALQEHYTVLNEVIP